MPTITFKNSFNLQFKEEEEMGSRKNAHRVSKQTLDQRKSEKIDFNLKNFNLRFIKL